jgi:2,3-bisphosphoglycerate-dependent phosphoglycerate mutase
MLALVRHGESQWNLENRFTGWIDIGLSPKGEQEARAAGEKLKSYHFDCLFTSVLKRAIDTATILCDAAGFSALATQRDQALNERHYGKLQGLNKAETAKEFGEAQVKIWRRSYDVRPPEGESLADTAARVLPYYEKVIEPLLLQGKNVLVVAHGNSLRALVMKLDNLTKEQIVELNIPTAEPIIYTFNAQGTIESKKVL